MCQARHLKNRSFKQGYLTEDDLLVLTSLDQVLLIMQTLFPFKKNKLNEEINVLGLSCQLVLHLRCTINTCIGVLSTILFRVKLICVQLKFLSHF